MAEQTTSEALPKTRAEARQQGLDRYFTGLPCRRGHIAPRDMRRQDCLECVKLRGRAPVPKSRPTSKDRMRRLIDLAVFGLQSRRRFKKNSPIISAGTPIGLVDASRELKLQWKTVAAWRNDPVFEQLLQQALRVRIECEEIHSLKVAIAIRDNPEVDDNDRLLAIKCIRGAVPKPKTPAVSVNVQQNNVARIENPAGYIINLAPDNEPTPPQITEIKPPRLNPFEEASAAQRAFRTERANGATPER